MFLYAVNHPVKKAFFSIKNSQELTPLNLAAKLGRKELFEKMLDRQNVVLIPFEIIKKKKIEKKIKKKGILEL